MSKEVEEAIKNCNLLLAGDIMLHILDDDGGTAYSGEVNKLYNKDLETVLNYIKELEEEKDKLKEGLVKRIAYCNELEKDLFENCENYVVNKSKIRDKIEEYQENMKKYEYADRNIFNENNIRQEVITVLNGLLEEE